MNDGLTPLSEIEAQIAKLKQRAMAAMNAARVENEAKIKQLYTQMALRSLDEMYAVKAYYRQRLKLDKEARC
jgi:putative heme iron utilization protein